MRNNGEWVEEEKYVEDRKVPLIWSLIVYHVFFIAYMFSIVSQSQSISNTDLLVGVTGAFVFAGITYEVVSVTVEGEYKKTGKMIWVMKGKGDKHE